MYKRQVEKPADARQQISLAEASRIQPGINLGDIITVEATPSNAGRIAAQTAKQVILQRLHEAEHSAIFEEYANKEGDILIGIVQRVEPKQILLDLGRAEAIMPANEQMPNERYRIGQRLRVYLLEVARTAKGPRLILSRSHPNLLRRLFELEVPEVYNGIVEIKSIAREAGHRSKIAVAARQEGIDPVGCCVGLRGIRIQNIVNELSGEKIDVIQWRPDPEAFISHALSPAQVQSVELNEAEQIAKVIVPDRQLSLAIGREGQNVRLAAKLTGWRIDIKSAAEIEVARIVKPTEEMPAVISEEVANNAQPVEAMAVDQIKVEEKLAEPVVEVMPEIATVLEKNETEAEEEEEPAEPLPTAALRPPVPIRQEVPAGQPVMRFAEDILELRRGQGAKERKKKKKNAKGEDSIKAKKKHKGQSLTVEDDANAKY